VSRTQIDISITHRADTRDSSTILAPVEEEWRGVLVSNSLSPSIDDRRHERDVETGSGI
jgi:hypothetical protein